MNRRIFLPTRFPFQKGALTLVLMGLLISGCQKSTDQPATSSATANGSDSSQSAQNQTPTPPPPAPPPLVVPADTAISVVLDESLSSKTATAGQTFSASVRAPIAVNGVVAIPKGAHVSGVVNDAKAAGRFKGGASLDITLSSVNVDGQDYPIDTSVHGVTSKGKGKRTAGLVGGGGAGGALIGGLAGGGKGALIGALVGAGAGTAGSAFTGKNDIVLSAETPLTFRLRQPVEIKAPR
jgi:hypothetical protein